MQQKLYFLVCALCAMLFSVQTMGQESNSTSVSFDATEFAGLGASGTGSEVSSTKNGVSFTCDKAYGDNTTLRCYKGAVINVSAGSKLISRISFECSGTYTGGLENENTVNSTTWSFTTTSQARITKITVYVVESNAITITVKIPSSMVTNYGEPYIFAWGDYTSSQWPGEAMASLGNNTYKYSFAEDVEEISCVISCGEGQLQTEDITDINSSMCIELGEYDEENDSYIPYQTVACTENTQPEVVITDPLQQVVLRESASVDTIIFINDEIYPWQYNNGYICSTNKSVNQSKSEFSFTYESQYQTQVQFSWINYYTSYHTLMCYVDGVYLDENTSTTASTKQFFLPAGTHVVTFRDSVSSASSSYNRTSGIRNIRVLEVHPLETVVLADGSMPLTFQNEETYPWIILSDGSIRNSNYGSVSSTSSFSTTFTITDPSLFSFDCISKIDNSTSTTNTTYHKLTTYINDDIVWEENGITSYANRSILLAPGTYTIRWRDWIGSNSSYANSTSRIQNISLTSEWTEVELEYAGTLGVEVLYIHDVLTDVKLLKIKGNLNSTDWSNIKQMTNLRGLDLSEASFTEIAAKQFQNRTSLNYLVLPEGVQTIGDYAFEKTQLRQLHIPSTVTSIGKYAFNESKMYNISFAEGSQLNSIGDYCFQKTSLKKIVMPNSVTSVGKYCFYQCSSLDTLILSDAITTLPSYMCSYCSKLSLVHFPQNLKTIDYYCFSNATNLQSFDLPESLRTINYQAFEYCSALDSLKLPIRLSSLGYYAFQYCSSLKYIKLPSSASVGYDNTFNSCTSVETIVCPSATPPSITSDPFASGRAKSAITLQVPSFAVATYKLDTYWYKFGTIIEGEDPDFMDIVGDLMLTNNRRPTGKPSIRIVRGGKLTVGGAAPMPVNDFEFLCSGSTSAAFVNSCPFMMADTAHTSYYMNESGKWYFMTPLYDVDLTCVAEHSDPEQFVFRYYNAANRASKGTGSSWQNVTDGVLHQGQGYIVQSNSTGWIRMPSINHSDTLIFRTEDVVVPLQTYTSESAANESWNFIGNPYPSYYDIWYMDFTAPITVWTGSTYKAYSIADDNYALRPMEAFFVQKPEAVDNIIFHREGRQVTTDISHSNTAGAPVRRTPSAINRKVYNLSILAANGLSDDARVVINDAASLSYELTCDASKFMSMDAECPQIYTIDGEGNRLAINERPLDNGIVALGMYIPNAGEYTLSAVATSDITLVDNQLGISHDLHSAPYIFSTDMAGENSARFALVFGPRPISTGIENIDSQKAEMGGAVYTLDGRCVGRISGSAELQSLHLPAGVYMIQSGNTYNKVIVR